MGRKKKTLDYETRTPDVARLAPEQAALAMRLHSFFDHERNVMVVEVVADTPASEPDDGQVKKQRRAGFAGDEAA